MIDKLCLNCNKSFKTWYTNAKFCSVSCYRIYGRKHKISIKKKEKASHFICPICGKHFFAFQRNAKVRLCSNPCRYKYKKTLKPHNYIELSKEGALDCVRKAFTGYTGKTFSPKEYDQLRLNFDPPLPSSQKIRSVLFGSPSHWIDVLKNAGLELESSKPSKDDIIKDLQRVANLLSQTPTCEQYSKMGTYTAGIASIILTGTPYKQLKWADSCRIAGLIPHTTHEGGKWLKRERLLSPSGNMVTFQSSYEIRFAKVLDRWNENWVAHYELHDKMLTYYDDKGKEHHYRPDFYLPFRQIYIETKGWYQEEDQKKMCLISEQHPECKILLVLQDDLIFAESQPSFDTWYSQSIL